MKAIELTFRYTEKEYVKAARQYIVTTKPMRKADIVVLPLLFVASVFYLFHTEFSLFAVLFFVLILLVLAIAFLIYFFIPIAGFSRIGKNTDCSLIFSEEGVRFKTARADSLSVWSVFSRMIENDAFYFLVHTPQSYRLVPKRAFVGDEQRRAFEELVSKKLGPVQKIG